MYNPKLERLSFQRKISVRPIPQLNLIKQSYLTLQNDNITNKKLYIEYYISLQIDLQKHELVFVFSNLFEFFRLIYDFKNGLKQY